MFPYRGGFRSFFRSGCREFPLSKSVGLSGRDETSPSRSCPLALSALSAPFQPFSGSVDNASVESLKPEVNNRWSSSGEDDRLSRPSFKAALTFLNAFDLETKLRSCLKERRKGRVEVVGNAILQPGLAASRRQPLIFSA